MTTTTATMNPLFTLTVTDALSVSNAAEVIASVAAQDGENITGLFVPVGATVDEPGSYPVLAVPAVAEQQPNPHEWTLLATADYWATLWEQAQATQARLAKTGDPDDVHPDCDVLYWVLEDLAMGM